MRISDWSSDVCSSDLYERGRVERRVTCEMVVRAELKDGRAIEDAYVHSRFFNIDGRRYHLSHVSSEPAVFSNDHFLTKIDEYGDRYRQNGRESCRERVCQYV